MAFTKIMAFFMALITLFTSGVASVIGTTDAEPIVATKREYRFDRDRLLFGAYCFKVDEHFEETREWFKEAGLQFPVAVSGRELTEEDLDWFTENGLGVIAPRSDYYLNTTPSGVSICATSRRLPISPPCRSGYRSYTRRIRTGSR